jgi:hypothetical protein
MASKNKSKHVVALWVVNPDDLSQPKTKEYTFHYIPSNVDFVSDALQRVSLWRSSSRGSIIRVQSTDIAGKKVDILYSGYVQPGSVVYFEAQDSRDYYVEALLALRIIDKTTFEFHMNKVKSDNLRRSQEVAKQGFISACTEVGLILNKSQMLRIEKHFSGVAK